MVSSLSMPSCGFERYTGPSMLAAWKFIVGPCMPTRFSSIFRDVARTFKGGGGALLKLIIMIGLTRLLR